MQNDSFEFKKITGLVVAPFTPLSRGGEIDLKKIEIQANLVRKYNLTGVFVCGTTGEGLALMTEERMRIAEKWRLHLDDKQLLIVHVGHDQLSDAQRLAHHAQHIGADAIGVMGPITTNTLDIDELVDYSLKIATSAAALPFYYYHIPVISGLFQNMYDYLQIVCQRIQNFAGIKYTYENLDEFSQCVHYKNFKYNVLFGRDEILLYGLKAGARGAIGSFYNYAAPLFHELLNEFKSHNMERAQQLQERIQQLASVYFKHGGNVATGKAIMKIAGLDCGPVRTGLQLLSKQAIEALENDLAAIGFKEFSMTI